MFIQTKVQIQGPKISSISGMSSSLVVVITFLEIWDVTEVHALVVWCWFIFWSWMWQVQAVCAGTRTQEMWLWLFMNTWMSMWNWIFKPNVIIQWGCGKIFCCNVPERIICAWCRCVVVINVVLCLWRRFCSSAKLATIWCRALLIKNAEHQMMAYGAAAAESPRGVFWVLCSCGKWCGGVERDMFTCRNSHSQTLHLLVRVLIQKCHLSWSQSNLILFLKTGSVAAVLSCCRRMLCKLILWQYWGCDVWDLPSKVVMLLLQHSI